MRAARAPTAVCTAPRARQGPQRALRAPLRQRTRARPTSRAQARPVSWLRALLAKAILAALAERGIFSSIKSCSGKAAALRAAYRDRSQNVSPLAPGKSLV